MGMGCCLPVRVSGCGVCRPVRVSGCGVCLSVCQGVRLWVCRCVCQGVVLDRAGGGGDMGNGCKRRVQGGLELHVSSVGPRCQQVW
jgi:hypothetical protein